MTRSLADIRSSGLCAGCGLCASMDRSGSVTMEESADGWLRPRVTGEPDERSQRAVEAACPAIRIVDPAREQDSERHPIWGPLADLRFSWSTDKELRYTASSGGGLSGLLAYLLETGEIDFVLTNTMSDTSPIRNAPIRAQSRADILRSAGSRYAPSAPLQNIDELLDSGQRFAFVGKPCDVGALRQLGRADPRVGERVPWIFAFFCAGVPSYGGTDTLLSEMGVERPADIAAFRYRGEGWPGFAKAEMKDGTFHQMDYDTSWGSILNRHLQFRCKICPDGIGEFADIAFADGWHLDQTGTASFDEAEGRSLTLVRNSRARNLIDAAIAAGYLESSPAEIEPIAAMQPFQANRKGFVPARLAAYVAVGHRPPRFEGLGLRENARRLPAKVLARNFLGTLRRLMKRRSEA